MDPLITNGVDPALLRVLERRGQERDSEMRRRTPMPTEKRQDTEEDDVRDPEAPEHEIDDLA
jgi:hypothetical protein